MSTVTEVSQLSDQEVFMAMTELFYRRVMTAIAGTVSEFEEYLAELDESLLDDWVDIRDAVYEVRGVTCAPQTEEDTRVRNLANSEAKEYFIQLAQGQRDAPETGSNEDDPRMSAAAYVAVIRGEKTVETGK